MARLWLGRFGLFTRLFGKLRLATRLLREPQVPVSAKAVLVGSMLYVIMPFDFVPDILPGLGQLDDVTVLLLAIEGALKLCPRTIVDHHLANIRARRAYAPAGSPQAPAEPQPIVIDAEWRRH
jgi:uncharacterized membrane protein YkvA (DUF1232 family)